MTINDATLYITDNGAVYCGAHLGATARYTGRDISGQPIEPITPEVVREARDVMGVEFCCEQCGRKASLLVTA